jgi:non-canonical purine NTP pyrophosphatase (RdgB/HAM1 family)
MQILFATHNAWKEKLFAPVFQAYGFDVITLADLSDPGPAPQEDAATPVENALIKARHYHSPDHPWVFGDDAGLEIDALNGEPGLHARRWGGLFLDDVDDQVWLDYLLERLKGVPQGERTAAFVAGWALIAPDGSPHTREIRAPFEISTRPLRPISPGSPITAVRIGPIDDLNRRRSEIQAAWEAWGILERLIPAATPGNTNT